MSKNLTRKGLAFGSLIALAATTFAGAPATAAGLADNSFVSLAPSSGTAYTVVAGAGKTFSLTSNEASTVAGGDLKFLVSDASDVVEVTSATSGRAGYTPADGDTAAIASNVVTVTTASATTAGLAIGDVIKIVADDITGVTAGEYKLSGVTSTTFSFPFTASNGTSIAMANGTTIEVLREARDTTAHTFVVDTGSNTASSNSTLVLKTTESTVVTRSVDVTAWVDSNDNDTLDSTEYASPTRTVNFKKASEITGVVTWTQPALGDTSLVAKVATTPELNGSQMSANDISVKYTRQGSTETIAASATDSVGDGSGDAGSTAWNSTDKLWVATAYTIQSADNTPWDGLADSAANDVVFAGTYTARPYIGSDAIASAVTAVVGSTQADDVKATIAATADNAAAANENAASATAVVVRTGKSVTVTAKIYDNSSTPVLVGAGIPVTATLSSTTGTIKVNAASTSDQELTDANGVVTFVVSSTTAAASDAATLTIQAQNVSTNTKQAAYTITWDDATVKLYDGSVANAYSDVTRSTAVGGSVSFSFLIADQFKQPLSGSYRLKVANTGRTVSTSYTAVTNGSATVTVTDGTVGSGTSISTAIDVEKDVSGTWTAQDLANDGTSDGNADTVTYTINLLTQTDAVKLDADGSSTYGSGTADDSDAIAAAATAVLDTRSSYTAVPSYANAVTVTGRIVHSTTDAARAGALVTVSGDASILFATGGVYAFGSITFVTDSSGEFSVDAYSTKAATETVVTVTSNGASATRKVTFTGPTEGLGKSLTPSVSAIVTPGSFIAYKVVLKDAYGNVVDTSTSGRLELTATGAGYFQSTPVSVTDSNGELAAVWVTPTSGYTDVVFTIKYSDADSDFTDTTDLSVATTVAVNNSVAEKIAADDKAAAEAKELAAKAKTVTMSELPSQAQAGRAIDVSVKVLNGAASATAGRTVTFTVVGAGYVGSNTVVTDANGVATVKLVAGSADLGTSTLTATVDGVSASKSIEFGQTDVTDISSAGKAIYVNTEFAKGKVVTVYIDGVRMPVKAAEATDNAVERKYTQSKAGKHVVTVRISGGISVTETVVTTN